MLGLGLGLGLKAKLSGLSLGLGSMRPWPGSTSVSDDPTLTSDNSTVISHTWVYTIQKIYES